MNRYSMFDRNMELVLTTVLEACVYYKDIEVAQIISFIYAHNNTLGVSTEMYP